MGDKTQETSNQTWLEKTKEMWEGIDSQIGKQIICQYPLDKFNEFGFGGWSSLLENDKDYDYWVLVFNNTRKKSKKKRAQLSNILNR